MLETLDQHFIQRYAADLRRELLVQGFNDTRVDEIVGESTAHLEEAMAAAGPQSADEARQVIRQFGSASVLATRLSAEELRPAMRGRFLWPMVFLPPALYLSMNPLPQARIFHGSLYIGTLYLLISAAILFVMGLRARRPLFGQFAALAVGMIVCQVAWYGATSYPVAYGPAGHPEWYEAVPRSGYDREISAMNSGIARERDIIGQISRGQRVFSGAAASKSVPAAFSFQGQYWLPEGVREVGLGIGQENISKGLLTSSWSTAVGAYNGSFGGRTGVTALMWEGDAARLLRQIPEEIAQEQRSMDYLKWIRTQPLSVQLLADYRMVQLRTVVFVALGALCTNAGWFVWVLFRMLARLRRRIFYGAGGWQRV